MIFNLKKILLKILNTKKTLIWLTDRIQCHITFSRLRDLQALMKFTYSTIIVSEMKCNVAKYTEIYLKSLFLEF